MTVPFIGIESFFDPVRAAKVWPKSIVNSEVFTQQLERRKELNTRLNDVLNALPRPDMPLEVAIDQGYVTEEQTAGLYASLSELLESNQDYRRLILYLPFEFLPNKTWHPFGKKLQQALERFGRAYMEAWKRLLLVHDVRANFIDGDILEEDQQTGKLPRVVKAAHLIPKLVEHGLIEIEDVLTLMEENDDQTLRDSIADTLPVLADLGFIDERKIKPRKKQVRPEPKIITEKRKIWLQQREKQKTVKDLTQVVIPKLAGPFSENLILMAEEMRDIQKMAASIESNLELSKLIYPVVLVFGSRLSGYGDQNADIDIGILIKPKVPFSNRSRLQKLLKETFAHEKILGDEIKEFWLEEKEGHLKVHDFAEWDLSLSPSYWTHILFGAAWIGDENVIRESCERLLTPYLYDTSEARRLYLEDMEQATLQYRLMHKGYERFFPSYGGIQTPHADEIDGKSMFWDSGYRQLATKLFVSRVFLPKIPINKK